MRACYWVLGAAIACAGCSKGEKGTTDLVSDLKTGEGGARVTAARTLPARKGDSAQVVPALTDALKDHDADVRRSAAIGLGGFGAEARDAVPALQASLADRDARVREAAGKALTHIDPARFPTPPKGTRGK